MKTLTNEECALLHGPSKWDDSIDRSVLCAIPQGYDSNHHIELCDGDAGSPLVKDGLLIGIAIWNFEDGRPCDSAIPNQFTRISEYLAWIKKHVNVSIR